MLIDADKVSVLSASTPREQGWTRQHGGDPAAAVAELLAGMRRRGGAWRNRLRVWLGYPWAQAQVLPWQAQLGGGDSHWEAYALGLMRERGIDGPLRLRLDPGAYGRARMAYGADAEMLDALEASVSAGGWRLQACHDLLSSCLSIHRAVLRDAGQGLVLVEAEALSCLWWSDQGWDDLITLRREPAGPVDALVSAAELLCGREGGTDYCWSAVGGSMALPAREPARWLGAPHPLLAEAA